jgi:hypothetical protein
LTGKEAATPSRTWQLLSSARPEMILFLAITARQQAVAQKIKNFFTKWRQVQQKIPLPEMTELHITPQMPEYPKIAQRCVPAVAGWQAAFADGDFEVPEAAGAATSAATTASAGQARPRLHLPLSCLQRRANRKRRKPLHRLSPKRQTLRRKLLL